MPPRLQHKKSRNGCRRCKARRVKCDEVHPICSNCARHNVTCDYPPIASFAKAPRRPAAKKSSSSAPKSSGTRSSVGRAPANLETQEPEEPEVALGPKRRLLELRLLHWFITVVVYTFPSSHTRPGIEVWTVDGVRLGLQHPFLLNAMLALAALHLASENTASSASAQGSSDIQGPQVTPIAGLTGLSHDPTDYTEVHKVYLNLAIGQQRDAVANINSGNANAITMSTILLQYHAFKNSHVLEERSVYSPPLQWLRMAKAIVAVAQTARPLIVKDSVMHFMAQTQNEPNFLDHRAIFGPSNYLGNPAFEALLDFDRYPEPSFDEETKAVYQLVMGYVGGCWRGILRGEETRVIVLRLMSLGPLCPMRFIDFIEQRRPRALAVLAHHFSMARVVDDHWLFKGFAEKEVRGIHGLLPESWHWAMDWPERVLIDGIPDMAPAAMLPSPEEPMEEPQFTDLVRRHIHLQRIK